MRTARTLLITLFIAATTAATALADGLSINLPLVGRVIGGGNTLYLTAVDVTNQAPSPVTIDFYFDGMNTTTNETVAVNGSIGDFGLVQRSSGTVAPLSNQHFDDFIDALVRAGLLPSRFRDEGVLGSLLLVYNGYARHGQGAASARFYNALAGGYVGVAVKGHEISENEPQRLVAAVRDTRGRADALPVYPNVFINNTGLTPDGVFTNDPVTVRLSAVSARTGQGVGNPVNVTIASGLTANIGQTFQALGVSNGSEDTILVYATVISGSAAIEGLVSQVDPVTKDSSAFEMSRADF